MIVSATQLTIYTPETAIAASRIAPIPRKGAFFTTKMPPVRQWGASFDQKIAVNASGARVSTKNSPSVEMARDFDRKTRRQRYWHAILVAKMALSSAPDTDDGRENRPKTVWRAENGGVSAPS